MASLITNNDNVLDLKKITDKSIVDVILKEYSYLLMEMILEDTVLHICMTSIYPLL